jgi:excisionase family DNA binding protein
MRRRNCIAFNRQVEQIVFLEEQMPASLQRSKLNTLPQAAEQLGVSVKCLRSWIYRRSISYVKVGRAVRISDETIQRIIDQGTIPALEERA